MAFLENLPLSKDVCQFSELHNHHAGLSHPASITIAHSPVPVLSQSKPCCFNDLLYPSSFHAERMRMENYKGAVDVKLLSRHERMALHDFDCAQIKSTMATLSNFTRVRMTAAVQ
ncbi:hypothetical protein N7539_008694 [Penicillium diatomitis]|uniref:Uncharacterized protein n=1 Tax=Penicillium diatomitis TaxID=2819901 RepID=A0A9W9WR32_9EURO|nr:uncharacterized protein N7539_008694 [Penicillium diatomitis]KAJ5472125.1 hypothetical protein N7539_008694 [Penicillium diatomitis]